MYNVSLQTPTDSPWTENPANKVAAGTLIYNALDSLETWIAANQAFLPTFDAAALYSGYDNVSLELDLTALYSNFLVPGTKIILTKGYI